MLSSTSFPQTAGSRLRQLCFLVLSGVAAALVVPSSSASHVFRSVSTVLAGTSASGYWHTSGRQILDAHGHPVRISGLNWSGFETPNAVPGGLEAQDYRSILHTIKANGFNTVRIPLSNEVVESPGVPTHVSFRNADGEINGDLRDLNSMEILDRIVHAAGETGLKVILDNHRSEAGSSAEESGLWYTERYPETAWIADWVSLARHYQGDSTVIGVDLRNEPHNAGKGGACWDCGGANDWHHAAERAGNAVLRVNPRLLIFVEGVDEYHGSSTWWGGNLAGVRQSPVQLSTPGHLVYSAHVYGPTEYEQPWFNPNTSSTSLASLWRHDWAFISENNLAPVWIGEFGTPNDDSDVRSEMPGSEGQWFSTLISFLQSHSDIGWTYWGANGEDRYALLDSDYSSRAANPAKALALASIAGPAPRPSVQMGTVQALRTRSGGANRRTISLFQSFGLNSRVIDRDRESTGRTVTMTVVPVESASPASGDNTPEARTEARLQVAQSWRSPAPVVSYDAVLPVSQAAEAPISAPHRTRDSRAIVGAGSQVDSILAEQIRQATADALRHGDGTGGTR